MIIDLANYDNPLVNNKRSKVFHLDNSNVKKIKVHENKMKIYYESGGLTKFVFTNSRFAKMLESRIENGY